MNNSYGTFEYITPDYVVAGVKQRLGIRASSEDDLFIEDLCNQGAKRLNSMASLLPTVATLQIVDFKAKLPIGFVKFNKSYPIRYTNAQGQATLNQTWYAPQFVNNTFFEGDPNILPAGGCWEGSVNVVNGYLYFSTNVTAQYCKIEYLGTYLDADGNIMIPAIAEDCLIDFCRWQYVMAFPKSAHAPFAGEYKRGWQKGKKWLRSVYNGDQGYDRPYIAYKMKTLC